MKDNLFTDNTISEITDCKDNLTVFIEWVNIPSNQFYFAFLFFYTPICIATIIWFFVNFKNKK